MQKLLGKRTKETKRREQKNQASQASRLRFTQARVATVAGDTAAILPYRAESAEGLFFMPMKAMKLIPVFSSVGV
jgi:hypothetical protein